MSEKVNLNGLVLAGGQSTRMGRDKGELIYHDSVPQREWAYRLLEPFCDYVVLSLQRDQKTNLSKVVDRLRGIGVSLISVCEKPYWKGRVSLSVFGLCRIGGGLGFRRLAGAVHLARVAVRRIFFISAERHQKSHDIVRALIVRTDLRRGGGRSRGGLVACSGDQRERNNRRKQCDAESHRG